MSSDGWLHCTQRAPVLAAECSRARLWCWPGELSRWKSCSASACHRYRFRARAVSTKRSPKRGLSWKLGCEYGSCQKAWLACWPRWCVFDVRTVLLDGWREALVEQSGLYSGCRCHLRYRIGRRPVSLAALSSQRESFSCYSNQPWEENQLLTGRTTACQYSLWPLSRVCPAVGWL